MPTSNTFECFREFVGQRVIGVMRDALPSGRRDIAKGTKTLIFEDGRGLTFSGHGTYWVDSAEDVRSAVGVHRKELEAVSQDLTEVIELAGSEHST